MVGFLDALARFLRRLERALARQRSPLPVPGPDRELPLPAPDFFDQILPDLPDPEPAIDSTFGNIFDALEDDITEQIMDGDPVTPDSIEGKVNDAEGAAIEDAVAAVTGLVSFDLATNGNANSHEELVAASLSFLGLENVLGLRSQLVVEEVAAPALSRALRRQRPTKVADLKDFVENALRQKATAADPLGPEFAVETGRIDWLRDEDTGWLGGTERYGLDDQQARLLEFVALNSEDPEQLFEELPQAGLVPSEDAVEAILALSGHPGALKEEYRRMQRQTPRRADLWEQQTTTGELVQELTKRVQGGELTPAEAMNSVPPDADEARDALRERFELHEDLAPKAPSQTDFVSAFAEGYLPPEELSEALAQEELNVLQHPGVLQAEIVSELDGSLQGALATGRVTEREFAEAAEFSGLDDDAIDLLLQGQSFSDIVDRRLAQQADPREAAVGTIVGIGESREAALQNAGLGAVADLAQADPERVADVTGVTPETAVQFINRARRRVQRAS